MQCELGRMRLNVFVGVKCGKCEFVTLFYKLLIYIGCENFFLHPIYRGESVEFFSKFEVFFIIWIHLRCPIFISPRLGVYVYFSCDHVCF